ncbi:MAG: hypothetical protein EB130_07340 [Actinobacteria bacterium]|nr:hypothetical protein [Actinomycetota bacterium]
MDLLTTLAINWQPQLRGYTVVIIAVVVLIGGTYLVVGTNLGARLGFLVILAGLFGWMVAMGAIWWTYGIGLKGREPSWKEAAPATIIRDGELLQTVGILEQPLKLDASPTQNADLVATALASERAHGARPRQQATAGDAHHVRFAYRLRHFVLAVASPRSDPAREPRAGSRARKGLIPLARG